MLSVDLPISRPRRARTSARKRINESFAASAAWMLIGPMESDRFSPDSVGTPGTSTTIRSASETSIAAGASGRRRR